MAVGRARPNSAPRSSTRPPVDHLILICGKCDQFIQCCLVLFHGLPQRHLPKVPKYLGRYLVGTRYSVSRCSRLPRRENRGSMRECWLAHAHILYVLKYLYVVCMYILYVCLFACRDILPVSCQSQRHRVNHFEVGDRLTGGFGLCLQRKYIVPDTRHQILQS